MSPPVDEEASIAAIAPGAGAAIAVALAALDAREHRIEAAILAAQDAQRQEAAMRAAAWGAVAGLATHPVGRVLGWGLGLVLVLGVARALGVERLLVDLWPGVGIAGP